MGQPGTILQSRNWVWSFLAHARIHERKYRAGSWRRKMCQLPHDKHRTLFRYAFMAHRQPFQRKRVHVYAVWVIVPGGRDAMSSSFCNGIKTGFLSLNFQNRREKTAKGTDNDCAMWLVRPSSYVCLRFEISPWEYTETWYDLRVPTNCYQGFWSQQLWPLLRLSTSALDPM